MSQRLTLLRQDQIAKDRKDYSVRMELVESEANASAGMKYREELVCEETEMARLMAAKFARNRDQTWVDGRQFTQRHENEVIDGSRIIHEQESEEYGAAIDYQVRQSEETIRILMEREEN